MAGMVLGYALQLGWLQSRIGWMGLAAGARNPSRVGDGGGPRFTSAFLPLLGATAALQVNVLAERFFASWLAEGSITFLSYAYRLATVPVVVITLSLLTAVYPTLVTRHANGDTARFFNLLLGGLHWTLALLVPGTVFLIVFGEPIASLLFQRGAFSDSDAAITGRLVTAYAIGVPALGLALLASRALLARGETKTILRAALASMFVTVGLDALLWRPLGAFGLALAASMGALAYAWLTWAPLVRSLGLWTVLSPMLRWMTAGFAAAAALSLWPWKGLLGLAAAGLAVLAVTGIAAWALGERGRFYHGIRGH
jgi:peptidoglycan biosynthesis protein MviN/MurJ (putative lipid II flippase)